jgi:hypothetical protein
LSAHKQREPIYNSGTALSIDVWNDLGKNSAKAAEAWVVFFCERNVKPSSSKAVQKNTTKPAASFGKQKSKQK